MLLLSLLNLQKHEISRYMAKPAQAIVDAVESGTDLLERIHASSVSTLHDFQLLHQLQLTGVGTAEDDSRKDP